MYNFGETSIKIRQLAHKDMELREFLFLPNDFLPDARINYQGVVDIRNDEVLWPRRDLGEF